MIRTVVTTANTVTVITMTANTVDREGLQMKRIKMKKSVLSENDWVMACEVNPVRNSSGALNPAEIILKSNPAAAAGPEGLPPGHEPFRGGAWPGGSSGALFLTG
jgi:hypothetical protein